MAEPAGQENRTIDLFGPQFLIETGSRAVGVGGPNVFNISSINDDGIRYTQSFTQTGKAQSTEAVSFIAVAHNGDACLNANKGWIRIKGRNIVLDATNQMHLLANDIRIGRPQVDGTERILLNATEIDAGSPRKGNIADLLKTSSIYRVGLSLVGMTPLGLKAQAISKGISFAKKFFG